VVRTGLIWLRTGTGGGGGAIVNTLMKLRVPQNARILLSRRVTWNSSRGTQLHGKPNIDLYPKPDESSQHSPRTCIFKANFNIILSRLGLRSGVFLRCFRSRSCLHFSTLDFVLHIYISESEMGASQTRRLQHPTFFIQISKAQLSPHFLLSTVRIYQSVRFLLWRT
jgi:hypothetical protein